jgi:hypothetical protein
MTTSKIKLKSRLESLERTHSLLNDEVDRIQNETTVDANRIGALKVKKLQLRDQMAEIQKQIGESNG